MKLRHKTSCRECPFRKASLPGYLGEATPEQFIATVHADHEMPCHLTVDYEDPKWKEKLFEDSFCAGSLIYARNVAMMSRDAKRPTLEKSDGVFASRAEFVEHHTKPIASLSAVVVETVPDIGPCMMCSRSCTTEHYCYGCKHFVCEGCDRMDLNFPNGPHLLSDHAGDDDEEAGF